MTKNKGNLNPPQPSSAPLSQARGCVSKPMRRLLGKNNSRVGRTWAKQVYKEGWMVGEMEARTPSVASSNPIGEDSNPCKGTVDKGGLSQLRSPSLPFPNKISLKPLLEIQKRKKKKTNKRQQVSKWPTVCQWIPIQQELRSNHPLYAIDHTFM